MPPAAVIVAIAAIALCAIFALTLALGGRQMRCLDRKAEAAPSRRRAF
jgi:hypothetical protein